MIVVDWFAGAVQLNEAAMQQLQQQGYSRDLVLESLLAGDCNAATAAYHLMQQALVMKQEAAYSSMQPSQPSGNNQTDTGFQGKRVDTPVKLLSRSHIGQAAAIQAYRPGHADLEVEGVSAGCDKGQRQHSGRVSDDSARALHQPAALHIRNGC